MLRNAQQTGMRGVFLVAAELAARGLVVSTTSRNAMGADLLVADTLCASAFSVQVKTNAKPASFWLVGKKAQELDSPSHYYVFVNLRPTDSRHEYFVVPSQVVAAKTKELVREKSTWYAFYKRDADKYREKWEAFGHGQC
jgi:hypothetical protein